MCQPQVLCRHHHQYQHHLVCLLHQGRETWFNWDFVSLVTLAKNLCLSFSYLISSSLSTSVHQLNIFDRLKLSDKRNMNCTLTFFTFQCTTGFYFLLVCQPQVLCRHHLQYRHHRVCPLLQGNETLLILNLDTKLSFLWLFSFKFFVYIVGNNIWSRK